MGTTVTNQNSIQEKITGRLNSDNACFHSPQNLLSSRLLCKDVKIRIYKPIVPPVILCGYGTLLEKHKLRVFENRVLRRIFGPKRRECGGNCIMKSFVICTLRQV
jgi:hypothetical protein